MTIADFEAVLRLWQQSEGVGLNESDERQPIAAYLKRNPSLSHVAVDGTKIVGAVLCGHDGRRGYLHHLAVAKSHRKRGLGKALVEECLADLGKAAVFTSAISFSMPTMPKARLFGNESVGPNGQICK